MRIYIAGPITGIDNYKSKFRRAKAKMQQQYPDAKIVNPSLLADVFPDGTHEQYMSFCLPMLAECDAIYLMDGWQQSQGATMEMLFAKEHGIQILVGDRK